MDGAHGLLRAGGKAHGIQGQGAAGDRDGTVTTSNPAAHLLAGFGVRRGS
jgi:hypothetical protein